MELGYFTILIFLFGPEWWKATDYEEIDINEQQVLV